MKSEREDEKDVYADGEAPCASTGAVVRATKSAAVATRAATCAMNCDMRAACARVYWVDKALELLVGRCVRGNRCSTSGGQVAGGCVYDGERGMYDEEGEIMGRTRVYIL